MSTNFKVLFKNRREQAEPATALKPGDAFPLMKLSPTISAPYERYMVLFISLSCRDCVELLTQLHVLIHLERRVILVTDGTAEENAVFTDHFRFPFEVVGIPYNAFQDTFSIAITPCALMVERGSITRIGSPHSKAELTQFWNGGVG